MLRLFSYTDKGPRSSNQDNFMVAKSKGDSDILVCVADGVGGNRGGEEASRVAISKFYESFILKDMGLYESMLLANSGVFDVAKTDPSLEGMASTLTAAVLSESNLSGVHSGDTRIYVFRGNGVKQLTEDHTEVAYLYREGEITKEEAKKYPRKNILISALGAKNKFMCQEFSFDLMVGDRVLVMSDGVYSIVSKRKMRDLSLINSESFDDFCVSVISAIKEQGAQDNYTLVGFEFFGGDV